jgi:hypothetical protein
MICRIRCEWLAKLRSGMDGDKGFEAMMLDVDQIWSVVYLVDVEAGLRLKRNARKGGDLY